MRRSCTCETEGICGVCRHNPIPELLPTGNKQRPPFKACHPNPPLGIHRDTLLQRGGCPNCRSRSTWRWHCSACDYKTAWVEDNVAADAEIGLFKTHHPTAW